MKRIYKGQTLFDGHQVKHDYQMTIENGIITKLLENQDLNKIEGIFIEGYVIPGLIDSHCHLLLGDAHFQLEHWHEKSKTLGKGIVLGYHHAMILLEQGIVACRDLGSKAGLCLGIRDAINSGLKGPHIVSAGQALCVTGGHGYEMSLECDGVDEIQKGVKTVIKEGVDLIKLMASGGVNSPGEEPGPPEMTLEEIKAATMTAHAFGKKVTVHAHGYTAIKRAVLSGVDSIEHGVYLDDDLIKTMKEKNIYLVPTLSAPYHAVKEGLKEVPDHPDHKESMNVLKRHREIVLKTHLQGVPIAFGTDVGTPYNEYKNAPYELVLMVAAGFSPEDAIRSATINSAALLDLDHKGALEVGKEGNFIELFENPLEHIETVMNNKRVFYQGECVKGEQI